MPEDSAIDICRVSEVTDELAAGIRRLIPQLTTTKEASFDHEALKRIVASDSTHLFVATSGIEVAGMITLILAPIPTGFHAYVEDVVVDGRFRGQGLAEKLLCAALALAQQAGATKIDLTSNPSREGANRLYQRLGFEQRITNVYRYPIYRGKLN